MRSHRLGLVVHPVKDVSAPAAIVARWVAEQGGDVVGLDSARLPPGIPAVSQEEFLATVKAVVSLGGDGTMLGALRLCVGRDIPVLGVNLGNLGFLVELEPQELPDALVRIAALDFTVEPHLSLQGTVSGTDLADVRTEVVAFNDLALARQPGRGTLTARLSIDDQRIGYYRCDALVLATPTGSTAYSYAAGGPVVSPGTDSLVLTPVAPMSGISRPVVLGVDEPVTLELMERSGCPVLEVDGIATGELLPGQKLTIQARRDAGQVIRLDPSGHGRRSRMKLSLLDLPLLPEELQELVPSELRRPEAPRRH